MNKKEKAIAIEMFKELSNMWSSFDFSIDSGLDYYLPMFFTLEHNNDKITFNTIASDMFILELERDNYSVMVEAHVDEEQKPFEYVYYVKEHGTCNRDLFTVSDKNPPDCFIHNLDSIEE